MDIPKCANCNDWMNIIVTIVVPVEVDYGLHEAGAQHFCRSCASQQHIAEHIKEYLLGPPGTRRN